MGGCICQDIARNFTQSDHQHSSDPLRATSSFQLSTSLPACIACTRPIPSSPAIPLPSFLTHYHYFPLPFQALPASPPTNTHPPLRTLPTLHRPSSLPDYLPLHTLPPPRPLKPLPAALRRLRDHARDGDDDRVARLRERAPVRARLQHVARQLRDERFVDGVAGAEEGLGRGADSGWRVRGGF